MKPARLIILGSAALAGVGAFFMIVGGSKPPAPIKIVAPAPPPPMDQVLVANRDIPFGNMVDRGDLRWQSWPPHAAPAGAILQARDPNAADESAGSRGYM
jgi:pilus assembly protein CpaB